MITTSHKSQSPISPAQCGAVGVRGGASHLSGESERAACVAGRINWPPPSEQDQAFQEVTLSVFLTQVAVNIRCLCFTVFPKLSKPGCIVLYFNMVKTGWSSSHSNLYGAGLSNCK